MTSTGTEAAAAVADFGEAFERGDVDGIMAHMTDDCIFESTAPALTVNAVSVSPRSPRSSPT